MSRPEAAPFLDRLRDAFLAGDADSERSRPHESGHVARIREMYSCIARGDFGGLGHLLADDVELEIHAPALPAFHGSCRGRDEVVAAVEQNFARVGEQAIEFREVVARGTPWSSSPGRQTVSYPMACPTC